MTDSELHRMVIERLQAVEHKLDSLINRAGDHEGRLASLERWVNAKIRRSERGEDAGQHRRNRAATLGSGILGGLVVWAAGNLPGIH